MVDLLTRVRERPHPGRSRGPARPGRQPTGHLVRRTPGFSGSAVAIALLCLSLTPSLLPRHWALQGVVSGLTMASGYAIGATLGAVVRRVWRTPPAPTRAWAVLLGAGTVLTTVFLLLGGSWQQELRELMGVPSQPWHPALIVAVAISVSGVVLLAARGCRLATRTLAAVLGRWLPRPAAAATAVLIALAAGGALGYGVGFHGLVYVAGQRAIVVDGTVPPELARPTSRYVSGGPGSLVDWGTLGYQGRAFVAGTAPVAELAQLHRGGPVLPPIRAYVGKDSAPDPTARAQLAVRELERTGAFQRSVVAVVAATGTGWVNPAVADSLEYLHGGDTAVVATQYSYLPSWVSFLAERPTATRSAAALITAVRDRVTQLPAGERPELVVYGESLGAYGIEAALGARPELLVGVDGALLVGPPHHSPTGQRLAGADGIGGPRVVYLQHPSDPVVRWTPELLYREPAWLSGSSGPDVSQRMRWLPVVTFWQVTVDLVTSTTVPAGHGHSYGPGIGDAWAALVPPDRPELPAGPSRGPPLT